MSKTTRLTTLPVFALLFIGQGTSLAQTAKQSAAAIPDRLPAQRMLSGDHPVTYTVTTRYINGDIFGNVFGETQLSGLYTRGLPGERSSWKSVVVSEQAAKKEPFSPGVRRDYMENFSYDAKQVSSDPSLFKRFPPQAIQEKNLVWDLFTLESFAWRHLDSLSLNKPYLAKEYAGAVNLDGSGTFSNKEVILTWIGLSRLRRKNCALIRFEVMNNPLTLSSPGFAAKGRSHYWGLAWINLVAKELVEAQLSEDVVLEIRQNTSAQLVNTVRTITVVPARPGK